jgi:hypothetical protein
VDQWPISVAARLWHSLQAVNSAVAAKNKTRLWPAGLARGTSVLREFLT